MPLLPKSLRPCSRAKKISRAIIGHLPAHKPDLYSNPYLSNCLTVGKDELSPANSGKIPLLGAIRSNNTLSYGTDLSGKAKFKVVSLFISEPTCCTTIFKDAAVQLSIINGVLGSAN